MTWMLVTGGDHGTHEAPGPWTRSAARATRAARRALDTARRLPGATWFRREWRGLGDYPPEAGDDPDKVMIPWLHQLRVPELHHDEYPRNVPGREPPAPPAALEGPAGGRAPAAAPADAAHPAGDPDPPAAGMVAGE